MSDSGDDRAMRGNSSRERRERGHGLRARNVSRADADQNWRERSTDGSEKTGTEFDSRRLQEMMNVINGRDSLHIPSCNQIKEEEDILEKFRSSMRYVGDYSEDEEGNFTQEKMGFHFLNKEFIPDKSTKMKEVKFDLKVAMEKAEEFTNTKYENFFKWIASESDILSSLKNEPNAERNETTFVARAPVWEYILKMPFYRKKFMPFVPPSNISGTIYIMIKAPNKIVDQLLAKSEEELEAIIPTSKLPEIFHDWSHKYEQYMCDEDITQGTVPNEQFRIVISSRLGPYKILSKSPIDAVHPDIYNGERNLKNFVKLCCTSVEYSDDPKHYVNTMKPIHWVLPMLVSGTDELIAGFCNEDGIVSKIRSYTVDDLLQRSRANGYFNIHKNFTFAVQLLDFMKKKTESNPGKVFYFERHPANNFVTCEKIDEEVLPEWFMENLRS